MNVKCFLKRKYKKRIIILRKHERKHKKRKIILRKNVRKIYNKT